MRASNLLSLSASVFAVQAGIAQAKFPILPSNVQTCLKIERSISKASEVFWPGACSTSSTNSCLLTHFRLLGYVSELGSSGYTNDTYVSTRTWKSTLDSRAYGPLFVCIALGPLITTKFHLHRGAWQYRRCCHHCTFTRSLIASNDI